VFGDQIELVRADFPPSVRRPGRFKLTLYFRVLSRPKSSHKIFVHLDNASNTNRVLADHEPGGGTLATDAWTPGQLVRDECDVDVAADVAPEIRTLYVGCWGRGDNPRMKVTSGNNDGRDRAAIGTITIE
jgi:hypothetical protein